MLIFDITLFWIRLAPSYYWLMYLISFVIWYYYLLKKTKYSKKEVEDLIFYLFLWVICGWRLGYVFFYNLSYYLNSPLEIIKVWEGGMSFHWWLIWFILWSLYFTKKYKKRLSDVTDNLALIAPIGLFFWRIGNYLNKELLWYSWYNWFLAVKVNWKSYFPSSLLEAFLEWALMLIIIHLINRKKSFSGQLACSFLILYGIFRFFVEYFFRQPDDHLGYIFSKISMWSILSLPMILFWLLIYIRLFTYEMKNN